MINSLCFFMFYDFAVIELVVHCMTSQILLQLISYILRFHPLQPPHLVNTVLLRELKLDDNSISSMEPLSKAWLPLLQTLSVSQNRWELQNVQLDTPLICDAKRGLSSLKNYRYILLESWNGVLNVKVLPRQFCLVEQQILPPLLIWTHIVIKLDMVERGNMRV